MPSQTTSIPDLLEREPELEPLTAAVAGAREGAGRSLLIEAPAWVGKRRLLASARALARDTGFKVLEARGAVLEREFAFGVARQLFEQPVRVATDRERDALFAGRPACRGACSGRRVPRWSGISRRLPSGRSMACTG